MIEYIAAAAVVGGIITVVDQQNLIPAISNNPGQKWFWDPSRYVPVPAARFSGPIPQPQVNPRQELSRLEATVIASEQMVNDLKRRHPELGGSKYILTT